MFAVTARLVEVPMAAGGDQGRKSEDDTSLGRANLADHMTKGKPWCEIDDLIRGAGGQINSAQHDKESEENRKTWQGR